MPMRNQISTGRHKVGGATGDSKMREQAEGKFVNLVNELHDACNSAEASWEAHGNARKERVSFGTNITTEVESSDGGLIEQKLAGAMTATERFHAQKFKGTEEAGTGKHVVLKVTGPRSLKKQRTQIKRI
jgi:hypothetical protein